MKPVAKVRAAGTWRRRRIDFTLEDSRNTDRFGIAETQEYMSKYSSLLSNAVGKSTVASGTIWIFKFNTQEKL